MPSDNQGKIPPPHQVTGPGLPPLETRWRRPINDGCCACNMSAIWCDAWHQSQGKRCCGWCDHHPHGTLDGNYGNG